MASPGAQMVKNLPSMWETQVQSLGQDDLLEKGMATHSNILAWRTPCTEKSGGLHSMDHKDSNTTEWLSLHLTHIKISVIKTVLSLLSRVWLFATPWTVTHQAPLSEEFSSQEYWSGLPFPSPGIKALRINKRWWGPGERRMFEYCWWRCKLLQSLWKTAWRFFNNEKENYPMIHQWYFWSTGRSSFIACLFTVHSSQVERLQYSCIHQVYQYHFPTARAHFACLCHILVILFPFQTFLFNLLWSSVISDIWGYCHNLLKAQMIDITFQ